MLIAGVDEVGRGPLAGPVTAAAVILDPDIKIEGLKDSKSLSATKRKSLEKIIKVHSLNWNIVSVGCKTVDSINILQASLLAMKRAVLGLDIKPDKALFDGSYTPEICIPCSAIIKGDEKYESVMAASIIAKVARDKYMVELDKKYPNYVFKLNKGYPTKQHLKALKLYGPCDEHRITFKPVSSVIKN